MHPHMVTLSPLQKLVVRGLQSLLLRLPRLSETRSISSRVLAFLKVWNYMARAKVSGDYLEFGVFEGVSFELALRSAAKFFPKGEARSPRFFAFDSFAGLPAPDAGKDSDAFDAGEYSAPRALFEKNIARAARGWEVHTVPGFYDESLRPELRARLGMKRAAFVNIDCDIYPSTIAALRFVGPLVATGTVLYFDDWFYSSGDMQLGEPRACHDWLAENPDIELVDFGVVGVLGKLFIVNRRAP